MRRSRIRIRVSLAGRTPESNRARNIDASEFWAGQTLDSSDLKRLVTCYYNGGGRAVGSGIEAFSWKIEGLKTNTLTNI